MNFCNVHKGGAQNRSLRTMKRTKRTTSLWVVLFTRSSGRCTILQLISIFWTLRRAQTLVFCS